MDKIVDCKQYTEKIPPEIWSEAEPLIKDAAAYSRLEFTAEDIYNSLLEGTQQLWVVTADSIIKFVWITEIRQQSARRVCIVYAAAGEMKYGLDFWPYMSHWMVGNKIDEAEVYCRPSMSRLLKRHGLTPHYEVLCINPAGEIL